MIYVRPEHEDLRHQVARFVAKEIEPNALAWDEAGFTPREVLRTMGALGWLGMMYPPELGGAGEAHGFVRDPVAYLAEAA